MPDDFPKETPAERSLAVVLADRGELEMQRKAACAAVAFSLGRITTADFTACLAEQERFKRGNAMDLFEMISVLATRIEMVPDLRR